MQNEINLSVPGDAIQMYGEILNLFYSNKLNQNEETSRYFISNKTKRPKKHF